MGKIRELYRKDGYYNAKVSYALEQADAKRARLNIIVDEGNKLYVTDIVIQGAKQLDPDDLKDELALSERGMLSWITGRASCARRSSTATPPPWKRITATAASSTPRSASPR
jgi:outer membrane protein assembly factor BamA